MKQHITEKQFLELSKRGMDKYRDAFMDNVPFDKMCFVGIGQMIEFLDEKHYWDCCPTNGKKYGYKDWVSIFKDSCAGDWFISDTDGHRYEKQGHLRYYVGELCDILWLAVKEVLNDTT